MGELDRAETRDMIHDVLSGWQAKTDAREELIFDSLKGINIRLDKLNGKVAEHEKTLNQSLPHTIANCPQQEEIKEIHEKVIKSGVIFDENRHFWQRASVLVAIAALIVMSLVGFRKFGKTEDKTEIQKQVTEIGNRVDSLTKAFLTRK